MLVRVRELNESSRHHADRVEQETKRVLANNQQLQLSLDKAWADLSESRKTSALNVSMAVSEAHKNELQVTQMLRNQLEQLQQESQATELELRRDVTETRLQLTRYVPH